METWEISFFFLYGEIVYLYTVYQAMESMMKRNRAYRQKSSQLIKWLDRLAHCNLSIKIRAEKTSKHTEVLSTNPKEEASTEANYEENYKNNSFSGHFHK